MSRPIDEIIEIIDSELVQRLTQERDALREVLREMLVCMQNQEKRESGEFHWPQHSFKPVWDAAKDKAIALITPPAGAGNGKEVGK